MTMANALTCPRCLTALKPHRLESQTAWLCGACQGLAINLAVLRTSVEHAVVSALWQMARAEGPAPLACPSCRRPLRRIHYADHQANLEADLCTACQLIWLDDRELDTIRRRDPPINHRATKPPRTSRPSFTDIERADDLKVIRTPADVIDQVMRIIWSTFQ